MKLILLMGIGALLTTINLQSAHATNPHSGHAILRYSQGGWRLPKAESCKLDSAHAKKEKEEEKSRISLLPEFVKEVLSDKDVKVVPLFYKNGWQLLFSTLKSHIALLDYYTHVPVKRAYKGTDITGATLFVVCAEEIDEEHAKLEKTTYTVISPDVLLNKRAAKPHPFVAQHCRFQAEHIAENWKIIKDTLKN